VIDHDETFIAGDPAASIKAAAGRRATSCTALVIRPATDKAIHRTSLKLDSSTSGDKQIAVARRPLDQAGASGGGHIAIFNNGQYLFDRTSQSSIVEINPFLEPKGQTPATTSIRRMPAMRRSLPPRHHKPVKRVSNRSFGAISPRPTRVLQPHRLRLAATAQR